MNGEITLTVDTLIRGAAIITAISVFINTLVKLYGFYKRQKVQDVIINDMREEQRIICLGLRGALQGLVETGCNGPCKEALKQLNEHINKSAHQKIEIIDPK